VCSNDLNTSPPGTNQLHPNTLPIIADTPLAQSWLLSPQLKKLHLHHQQYRESQFSSACSVNGIYAQHTYDTHSFRTNLVILYILTSHQFAQELLSTFSDQIGEVALIPKTGGIFQVHLVNFHILSQTSCCVAPDHCPSESTVVGYIHSCSSPRNITIADRKCHATDIHSLH
jgi:predicted Rdx family selenoprotein